MLPEVYQKWHHQKKGNSWEEFNTWIITNYLLDVSRPVKEAKAVKQVLVNIKGNLEEQTVNWRNSQKVSVPTDSQKLLSMGRGRRFEFKLDNKLRINPRYPVYYTLSWIACVDNYCSMHYTPKAKSSKYPRRTKWDKSKTKF